MPQTSTMTFTPDEEAWESFVLRVTCKVLNTKRKYKADCVQDERGRAAAKQRDTFRQGEQVQVYCMLAM